MRNGEPDWQAIIAGLRDKMCGGDVEVGDVVGALALSYYDGKIEVIDAETIHQEIVRTHSHNKFLGSRTTSQYPKNAEERKQCAADSTLPHEPAILIAEAFSGQRRHPYEPPAFFHQLVFRDIVRKLGLSGWAYACAHGDRKAERDFEKHAKLASALGRPKPTRFVGRPYASRMVEFFFIFARRARAARLAVRHLSTLSSINPAATSHILSRLTAWGIAEHTGNRKGSRYRFNQTVTVEQSLSVYRAVCDRGLVSPSDLLDIELPGEIVYQRRWPKVEHMALLLSILTDCGHLLPTWPATMHERTQFAEATA